MAATDRLPVLKTYKLYIGGQFPRTESGRSYLVRSADGDPLANACRASRKDLRDAVRVARAASGPWAARTAMNRGQILYRVAELMEGRFDQFTGEVAIAEGIDAEQAREVVGRAIDRWVWYAGWADKIAQVLGSSNPVGAPYFNFTDPGADRRRRGRRARAQLAAGARVAACARPRGRQRRGRPGLGDAAAAG